MTIDTLSFQRTTDTLSLFQQGQLGGSSQSTIKADSDSLQLAQIHSAQEVISGFEGTPIPYSPRTDDAIALTLLACFFLSSIALARGKKFLSQQVKTLCCIVNGQVFLIVLQRLTCVIFLCL